MTAADRAPSALLGVGVLVPTRLCALLAEELRASPVGELRAVAVAAHQVAADHTTRRLRGSVAGTTVSVDQAAVMLRVSPGFVRRLLRSGDLEGCKGTGGIWQVDRASVERRLNGDGRGTRVGASAAS